MTGAYCSNIILDLFASHLWYVMQITSTHGDQTSTMSVCVVAVGFFLSSRMILLTCCMSRRNTDWRCGRMERNHQPTMPPRRISSWTPGLNEHMDTFPRSRNCWRRSGERSFTWLCRSSRAPTSSILQRKAASRMICEQTFSSHLMRSRRVINGWVPLGCVWNHSY